MSVATMSVEGGLLGPGKYSSATFLRADASMLVLCSILFKPCYEYCAARTHQRIERMRLNCAMFC